MFCVLPWVSKEVNFISEVEQVCCWINVDDYRGIDNLKSDFVNNIKPKCCSRCWESESDGIESRRQMENRFLSYALDTDIENIFKDIQETDNQPTMLLQVNVGSICNGSCVTCGPVPSSQWRSLLGKGNRISVENRRIDKKFAEFKQSLDWSNVKRINILGGEPLLIKRSNEILECLLIPKA